MESIDPHTFLNQFSSVVNTQFNAIEIDAEKNPKTKEFLFLRSIELIKGITNLYNNIYNRELLDLSIQFDKLIKNRDIIYYKLNLMLSDAGIIFNNETKTLTYNTHNVSYISYTLDIELFNIDEVKYIYIDVYNDKLRLKINNGESPYKRNIYCVSTSFNIRFDGKKLNEIVAPLIKLDKIYKRAEKIYTEEIRNLEKMEGTEYDEICYAIRYYNEHKSEYKDILNGIAAGFYETNPLFGATEISFTSDNKINYTIYCKGLNDDEYCYNNQQFSWKFTITTICKYCKNWKSRYIQYTTKVIPLLNPYYEGIEHARKQIEIERLYHHLSELVAEEARLTKEIEDKQVQSNMLKETIGTCKLNLKKLENEILAKTCERDELDEDCRRLRLYQELNSCELDDRLLIEEKKAFESIPFIHLQYKSTRRCFDVYSDLLLNLEHKKIALKEKKCQQEKELDRKMNEEKKYN